MKELIESINNIAFSIRCLAYAITKAHSQLSGFGSEKMKQDQALKELFRL